MTFHIVSSQDHHRKLEEDREKPKRGCSQEDDNRGDDADDVASFGVRFA